MIDIFGKDIKIIEPDEDHYQFTVLVNENGIVFLAQQYLDAIEIIDPINIIDKVRYSLLLAKKYY